MDDSLAGFGERLREARRRAGLSQGQLHVRSGVPKSRLSRYENGHLLPSLNTLRRITDALGITEGSVLSAREQGVDAFCAVLRERGVTFESDQAGRATGEAVADFLLRRPAAAGSA